MKIIHHKTNPLSKLKKNIISKLQKLKSHFHKKKLLQKIFFLLLIEIFFCNQAFSSQSRNLIIFSEPNMGVALAKIARVFSQKNNVIVSVNLNSSRELISEIDYGEPSDVFISAHFDSIETLRQKGMVDIYNISYIANDEIALVSSIKNDNLFPQLSDSNLTIEEALKIIDQNKGNLIIDNDSCSSGSFSNALIKNLSLSNLNIFVKLPEDKSSLTQDIISDNLSYGLALKSQIKNNHNLRVFATKKDRNIFYQALVLAGNNMETAREFLNFLKSDFAKNILKENGFLVS